MTPFQAAPANDDLDFLPEQDGNTLRDFLQNSSAVPEPVSSLLRKQIHKLKQLLSNSQIMIEPPMAKRKRTLEAEASASEEYTDADKAVLWLAERGDNCIPAKYRSLIMTQENKIADQLKGSSPSLHRLQNN